MKNNAGFDSHVSAALHILLMKLLEPVIRVVSGAWFISILDIYFQRKSTYNQSKYHRLPVTDLLQFYNANQRMQNAEFFYFSMHILKYAPEIMRPIFQKNRVLLVT